MRHCPMSDYRLGRTRLATVRPIADHMREAFRDPDGLFYVHHAFWQ